MSMIYLGVTSESLGSILRSWRMRSLFYTENAFFKLIHKPKDQVASEGGNNVFYVIDCSYCETD